MTKKLRAQLDQIDKWLIKPGGGDLWDVLSALRGPDNQSSFCKSKFTVPIRRKAFPRQAALSDQGKYRTVSNEVTRRANFADSSRLAAPAREAYYSHFDRHILSAVKALKKLLR